MPNDITSILETLASAKAAVDRVPELELQISALKGEVEGLYDINSDTEAKLRESDSALAAANEAINQLRAEREAYFLRAESAESKLARVGDLLGLIPTPVVTKSTSAPQAVDTDSVEPEPNLNFDSAPSDVEPAHSHSVYDVAMSQPSPKPWEVRNVSPTLAATHPDWIRTNVPDVPYTISHRQDDDSGFDDAFDRAYAEGKLLF